MRPVIVALVLAWSLGPEPLSAEGPTRLSHDAPYRGRELVGTTFSCKSDRVATAGFSTSVGDEGQQYSEFAGAYQEEDVTTWRVVLKGDAKADVTSFSGATQQVEPTAEFLVRRGSSHLLLLLVSDTSTQTITIDQASSTFMYSSQSLNPLWNRAAVFIGSCLPSI